MNSDLTIIDRSYYTLLDFFSDVGGLQAILFSFASLFLAIINQNSIDDLIVRNLFLIAPEKNRNNEKFSENQTGRQDQSINSRSTFVIKSEP